MRIKISRIPSLNLRNDDQMIYYECNKSGHMKFEFPKLKKSFKKDRKYKKKKRQALKKQL